MRLALPPTTAARPVSFAFVGEHRDDADHLLLLGEDGQYYGMHLPDGPTVPTDPAADDWAVEPDLATAEEEFG